MLGNHMKYSNVVFQRKYIISVQWSTEIDHNFQTSRRISILMKVSKINPVIYCLISEACLHWNVFNLRIKISKNAEVFLYINLIFEEEIILGASRNLIFKYIVEWEFLGVFSKSIFSNFKTVIFKF